MILDDVVTLAGYFFESRDVENVYRSTAVLDKPLFFENASRYRNRGTRTPEHMREKVLRQLISDTMDSVCAEKQPSGKPLLCVVLCITASRLSRLNKLRLNITERV